MRKLTLFILMLAATSAAAQQIDLKSLDSLVPKAKEKVEINLDESMLKSASGALTEKAGDEAAAKKVIQGLKGIYGRVFEFDQPYDRQVLESIRKQLKSPEWAVMVRVNEDDEDVEIWVHRTGGMADGMLLLVAESDELVVFNLVGAASLADLSKIGGQFGIPQFGGPPAK